MNPLLADLPMPPRMSFVYASRSNDFANASLTLGSLNGGRVSAPRLRVDNHTSFVTADPGDSALRAVEIASPSATTASPLAVGNRLIVPATRTVNG